MTSRPPPTDGSSGHPPKQLERFFWLDDADRERVGRRRQEATALGFAVQLGTVRFLGTFLDDPVDVPWAAVVFVAGQLGIVDPSCVKGYGARPMTVYQHQWDIRRDYGYHDFTDRANELRRFVEARAWLSNEGPRALFDRATAWCVEHKVLLPGVTTMARLVAEVRAAAVERLWSSLYGLAGDPLRRRLDGLLVVPEGARVSELERLRVGPTRLSAAEMTRSLARLATKRAELVKRFATLRSFWTAMIDVMPFEAAEGGKAVLAAAQALPALFGRKKVTVSEIDESVLAGSWRRLVLQSADVDAGLVDWRAYTLAVAESLHHALRRRDVFVLGAGRWGDPRAKLLSVDEWAIEAPTVLEALQLPAEPEDHLDRLARELDDAYRGVAARLPANEPATIEGGRVHLGKLDAQGEPASLVELRDLVDAMMPRVDLPELILEVHAWTGCLDAYTHLSEASARMDDLALSIAACLVAGACNLGYTPVINRGHPALTRARLSYVDQNYVRAETHRAANAYLIEHQAGIDFAQALGGGLVASADGMRLWCRWPPSTRGRTPATSAGEEGSRCSTSSTTRCSASARWSCRARCVTASTFSTPSSTSTPAPAPSRSSPTPPPTPIRSSGCSACSVSSSRPAWPTCPTSGGGASTPLPTMAR